MTNLFLLNFRETKAHGLLLEAGVRLFEQAPSCYKQAAICFNLSDPYFEGDISLSFKILFSKINLDDMCCLK